MFPVIDRIGTGRRIRQLMDARHITARDVQEHLALESVQGVYYWLNGSRRRRPEQTGISGVFSVSMDINLLLHPF